ACAYWPTTDGVGFEATVRYYRTHTFQACALNHSATRRNIVAEQTDRERFELSIPGSPVCRFSRPVPSTTRPPVQQPRKLSGQRWYFNPLESCRWPLHAKCDARRGGIYRTGKSS